MLDLSPTRQPWLVLWLLPGAGPLSTQTETSWFLVGRLPVAGGRESGQKTQDRNTQLF
uniref:Uncharacterized protein n=1 Tax=Mus musculus TaxID=10090 RepID=Q3UPP0_MOUSE|nr:unnamed protein product [Mus musculus]